MTGPGECCRTGRPMSTSTWFPENGDRSRQGGEDVLPLLERTMSTAVGTSG